MSDLGVLDTREHEKFTKCLVRGKDEGCRGRVCGRENLLNLMRNAEELTDVAEDPEVMPVEA